MSVSRLLIQVLVTTKAVWAKIGVQSPFTINDADSEIEKINQEIRDNLSKLSRAVTGSGAHQVDALKTFIEATDDQYPQTLFAIIGVSCLFVLLCALQRYITDNLIAVNWSSSEQAKVAPVEEPPEHVIPLPDSPASNNTNDTNGTNGTDGTDAQEQEGAADQGQEQADDPPHLQAPEEINQGPHTYIPPGQPQTDHSPKEDEEGNISSVMTKLVGAAWRAFQTLLTSAWAQNYQDCLSTFVGLTTILEICYFNFVFDEELSLEHTSILDLVSRGLAIAVRGLITVIGLLRFLGRLWTVYKKRSVRIKPRHPLTYVLCYLLLEVLICVAVYWFLHFHFPDALLGLIGHKPDTPLPSTSTTTPLPKSDVTKLALVRKASASWFGYIYTYTVVWVTFLRPISIALNNVDSSTSLRSVIWLSSVFEMTYKAYPMSLLVALNQSTTSFEPEHARIVEGMHRWRVHLIIGGLVASEMLHVISGLFLSSHKVYPLHSHNQYLGLAKQKDNKLNSVCGKFDKLTRRYNKLKATERSVRKALSNLHQDNVKRRLRKALKKRIKKRNKQAAEAGSESGSTSPHQIPMSQGSNLRSEPSQTSLRVFVSSDSDVLTTNFTAASSRPSTGLSARFSVQGLLVQSNEESGSSSSSDAAGHLKSLGGRDGFQWSLDHIGLK